jgi:hypothetical protein
MENLMTLHKPLVGNLSINNPNMGPCRIPDNTPKGDEKTAE